VPLLLPICSANTSYPFFYVISIALWRNARKTPLKGAGIPSSKGFHISQTTTNAEKCMHCWQRWRWQKAIFPNTRTIYGRRYNNARSPHANIQTQKGCSVRRRRRREKGITPRVLLLMRRRAGNAIGIPDKDCERPRGHYFIPLESKGDKKSFAVEQKYPPEPAYQHPESTHSTQMAARDQ